MTFSINPRFVYRRELRPAFSRPTSAPSAFAPPPTLKKAVGTVLISLVAPRPLKPLGVYDGIDYQTIAFQMRQTIAILLRKNISRTPQGHRLESDAKTLMKRVSPRNQLFPRLRRGNIGRGGAPLGKGDGGFRKKIL